MAMQLFPPLVFVAVVASLLLGRVGPQQRPGFEATANMVSLYVTVTTSGGRLVTDLNAADFEVFSDDDQPVGVTVFSRAGQPITAAIMLDMSNVAPDNLADLRSAGAAFVARLQPDDRVRIGTFGREVWTSPLLTNDPAYLLRLLREELWPGGPTSLWNGIDAGMSSLADQRGRRVVVVFPTGGSFPIGVDVRDRGDVERRAEREQYTISVIGFKGWIFGDGLETLAARTGGGFVELKSPDELDDAFAAVADELHSQYLLGFAPAKLDGRSHTVLVRVKRPGAIVRTRRSYVAAAGS